MGEDPKNAHWVQCCKCIVHREPLFLLFLFKHTYLVESGL
jgi:hypothetical protein